MAPAPEDQETREVGALEPTPVDDDAPTPRRGTPIARLRSGITRATLGLSRKHWSGTRFVALVVLLALAALAVFFAAKNLL